MSDDVNPRQIARGTPGFSGADLGNLVNEAALGAAKEGRRVVAMEQFEKAKDKILMGAERRSMVMSEEEKTNTAYHESGHTIVGLVAPGCEPVYKVSIIPRGRALGVTMSLPETDRLSNNLQQLESQLAMMFGGRIAEELIFGKEKVTTGASDDIKRATRLCRNMVTKWGLSERLGPLVYGDEDGEVFLGHSVTKTKDMSEETAQTIDQEVRRLVDKTYKTAKDILESKKDILHKMATALLKYETLDADQLKDIMEGREPKEPKDWVDSDDGKGGKAKAVKAADTSVDSASSKNNGIDADSPAVNPIK
jgi:cell division protease FtsH